MSKDYADADYLVGRLAMGDRAALGELIARYRKAVIGYFGRRTQLPLDFEHLTGLVFDKVERYAPRYIAKGRFMGWLFSIAHNVLLDEIRHYGRERARNDLWHVSNHGSQSTQASNEPNYDEGEPVPAGGVPASAGSDHIDAPASYYEGGRSEVVDVSFHTRGIDMSVRFNPRGLGRMGYSDLKEIRRFFRRFGLVDGPTPTIWETNLKNMKILESKSAFGGVKPVERDSSQTAPIASLNGASPPPATELTPPMSFIPYDNTVATCGVCARRTQTSPVGAEHVCRRCEREAAANWFVARQIATLGASAG
jgi:DNA-directed RNA polymerase specialized sigma24 family protein